LSSTLPAGTLLSRSMIAQDPSVGSVAYRIVQRSINATASSRVFIGWAVAPKPLTTSMQLAHQNRSASSRRQGRTMRRSVSTTTPTSP
jgi:hypothetical protein